MSDYPKEVWLVYSPAHDSTDRYRLRASAEYTASVLDNRFPQHAPHLIARVTPEWKKPEEQK